MQTHGAGAVQLFQDVTHGLMGLGMDQPQDFAYGEICGIVELPCCQLLGHGIHKANAALPG